MTSYNKIIRSDSLRWIGWIGLVHIIVLVGWMMVNVIFSMINPATIGEGQSLAEAGMAYYRQFPGYLGFDHGSKGLVMLLSIGLPIGLFVYLKEQQYFILGNLIGLVAGCLGFLLYALSLMLQAATVEYAFSLYNSTTDASAQAFAHLLYDWSMLEGGLSVSMYILANICLAVWVMIHSRGVSIVHAKKGFMIFGYVVGLLHMIGYLVSWIFLMQGKQTVHDVNEVIGLLFMIWLFIISRQMIRRKITVPLT